MLRALVVSFAILVVIPGTHAAGENQAASDSSTNIDSKQPTPNANSAAGATSGEDTAAENELLKAANRSRADAGVAGLRMDDSLREAARTHALRMIANDRLEHQFSGEPALLERIGEVSPLKIDRVGENVAYAESAPDVNAVLMHSAPHRENLLDRGFNVAGMAAIWSQGKLYVVQDFAHDLPSYSARESRALVGRAIAEMRRQAGLPELAQLTPASLDEATCSLAKEKRPSVHQIAVAYNNRRIITYTQSHPEIIPAEAVRLVDDPDVRQFAVGACFARTAAYPTGMYWVAILLY
ncbi:MAG: CAP domain-containing protein [Terriglobales bacterium]